MSKLPLAFAVLLLFEVGCQPGTTSLQSAKPVNVLKISIAADGGIMADQQPTTVEQLTPKLAELKKAGGEVWYHRANPAGEPHPNAMKVIELIAANQLPVRLSAKPDFSDAVDANGASQPSSN